jgi:hypothetical protein
MCFNKVPSLLLATYAAAFVLLAGCATMKDVQDAWVAAVRENTIPVFENFVKNHPQGGPAEMAKLRIQELRDTALFDACLQGKADQAAQLLRDGAQANVWQRRGSRRRPLLPSDRVMEWSFVSRNNSQTNIPVWFGLRTNGLGDRALHAAVESKKVDVVQILLNNGADVNVAGDLGNTPLHLAIYLRQEEIAWTLTAKGADANKTNEFGLRPFEMKSFPEVDQLVMSATALLDRDANWIDRDSGRRIYDRLQATKPELVVNAIALQVISGQQESRLQVLFLAIKLGIPGSEAKLASVLLGYGDKPMAEDFLNSGSSKLSAAGVDWAYKHGYRISTGPGSHRASWGRF